MLQLKEDDIYCLDQANPIEDALQIEAPISGLECQNVRNIYEDGQFFKELHLDFEAFLPFPII